MESRYLKLYKPHLGDDLPPFPERYITGHVVGRVDLIDVISLHEYEDTIPKKLQEPKPTDSAF